MVLRAQSIAWVMMLGVAYLVGCGGQQSGYEEVTDEDVTAAEKHEHDHDHDHDHHGPHEGEIIEIGDEEYHAEAVFDHEHHKVTLYILDAELKDAVAIEQKEIVVSVDHDGSELTYAFKAVPQEGDEEGKSSRFEVTSEEMVEEFDEHDDLEGKFQISIHGKEFSAVLTHHHHEEEGEHAHDHKHVDETKEKAEPKVDGGDEKSGADESADKPDASE